MNDPESTKTPPLTGLFTGVTFPDSMDLTETIKEMRREREADERAGRKIKLTVPTVFPADG